MAANEYYNPSSQQQAPQPTQPQYNYQSYNSSTPPPLSSAPSYHSQAPSRPGTTRPEHVNSPVSPFEAPFDDHVYPLHPPGAQRFDSQSTLGGDSRYYGQGGGGRMEHSDSYNDDIPLRDHPAVPPKDATQETDHVYDAPIAPGHLEEGRRKNRMSGMGVFKKAKGRIPWVTYILTLVQTIVFIVEIVKNGMFQLLTPC
jgi:hypothetical protein